MVLPSYCYCLSTVDPSISIFFPFKNGIADIHVNIESMILLSMFIYSFVCSFTQKWTHPHVVPNINVFLSSVEHKRRYFVFFVPKWLCCIDKMIQ